ncbi:kinase-like protein [Calocera cornea HHB12733]|uniref:Kinase-like protein n=1 Tax=Calocera cornea HHB12733 TaxID=1353952 RepID=A0A165D5P6_9BASI|nr:kinase-like protein [Calocera cornea HHB12733]
MLDIARGLQYLHSTTPNPILHGDLKGNNILVRADPVDLMPRAQLCDFGLSGMATEMDSNLTTTSTVFNGDARWLAWERIDPERYGIPRAAAAMTTASDVSEMMRTFWQIMKGKVPYHGRNNFQVQAHIHNQQNPDPPTDSTWENMLLWHAMKQCWSPQREDRYDCGTVMTILEYLLMLQTYGVRILTAYLKWRLTIVREALSPLS